MDVDVYLHVALATRRCHLLQTSHAKKHPLNPTFLCGMIVQYRLFMCAYKFSCLQCIILRGGDELYVVLCKL